MDEATRQRPVTEALGARAPTRRRGVRAHVRALPGGALAWRVGVTILGLAVMAGGVLLLPLPGPGWLIIFAGLGLLATEYEWASRLLGRGRRFVTRWSEWTARQGLWVRILLALLGLLFLAAALYGSWYLYKKI